MKGKICLYILLFLVFSSIVMAVPPAKKTTPSQKTPVQTVVVQNVTNVIVQNNTASAQQEGIDWNLVGGISAIIALAGALVGWLFSRKQRGMTAKYINEINKTFSSYKDNACKCESALMDLKEKVDHDFSKGKINESAFSILDARIDKYLSELRKDVVHTQFTLTKETKKDLDSMLEDGIITEKEYEKYSKMKINELSNKDKKRLDALMGKWKSKNK